MDTIPNQPNRAVLLKALLAGWVAMVFGTSALIFFLAPLRQVSYSPNPVVNSVKSIWEIADEMGPAVKISLVLVFALLLLACRNALRKRNTYSCGLPIICALVSVVVVLAFLPADFSRGYGIGLTGSRFDMRILPLYMLGAGLGGVSFAFVANHLSKNPEAE